MGVFLKKNQQNKGQTLSQSKGFTLIEIVLVLAIAGVIFLIVFLAVQAANRGKKDTAAQAATARLLAAAEQYSSNNGGVYDNTCAFATPPATYFNGGGYVCSTTLVPNAGANSSILHYSLSGTTITVQYWSFTAGALQTRTN